MAEERHPPSTAAIRSAAGQPCPSPSGVAQFRRSVSIFSRRGSQSAEPTPPFVAQVAMNKMTGPSYKNERQKSWLGRRKSARVGPSSPNDTIPASARRSRGKGTILNAVPQAKTIRMTSLEEEMSTSPNEEILSAISSNAPGLQTPIRTDAPPVSPLPSGSTRRSTSTASMFTREKSASCRDRNSRVGVWVNGVIHWDEGVFDELNEPQAALEKTGFTPFRPTTANASPPSQKPQLSVVIPMTEPLMNDHMLSTIAQPKPRRVAPVAPANMGLTFQGPFEDSTSDTSKEVSPLEPESGLQVVTPPVRPHGPIPEEREKLGASRSSCSSSTQYSEAASSQSRRSSATSVAEFESPSPPNTNKPLPPTPPPERAPPLPPAHKYFASKSLRIVPRALPLHQQIRPTRSMTELDRCDWEFIRSSPYSPIVEKPSPTLSQAEQALKEHLDGYSERNSPRPDATEVVDFASKSTDGSLHRTGSVQDVMCPPARAPTIPKRSRKREWLSTRRVSSKPDYPSAPEALVRRRSEGQAKPTGGEAGAQALRKSASIAHSRKCSTNSTVHSCRISSAPSRLVAPAKTTDQSAAEQLSEVTEHRSTRSESVALTTSECAEDVLLTILSSLKSIDDLLNTALINKGMFRVYKEHEMDLLRAVTLNQSAPSWELREWSPPARHEVASSKSSSLLEHTPTSYVRCYRRDLAVIEDLKRLILEKCQTFIRRETAFALSTPTHPNAARFNDAFWRIWCFCKIFGCNKGREEDITGQLDWLKGGLLANNQGCAATVNTNLDFDAYSGGLSSVLLNPPEHFARANRNGLSATQLFDMTEIWTCLSVLLQPYAGFVDQARRHGIFAEADCMEGDLEREEHLLEEWLSHLLTLGPDVVLAMATQPTISAGFALAQACCWTTWTPPVSGGSSSLFLKEPVAKSYEEQILLAKNKLQDPREQEKKEQSRQRVATLAAEIRLRRQSSAYQRLPLIDMSTERAMSNASSRSQRSARSPASLWAPSRLGMGPIIEERGESTFYFNGVADDTAEHAVEKIVNMGFTTEQAKNALKITDMGDGLDLERAVNYLLVQS